jgi:hypothetical protein
MPQVRNAGTVPDWVSRPRESWDCPPPAFRLVPPDITHKTALHPHPRLAPKLEPQLHPHLNPAVHPKVPSQPHPTLRPKLAPQLHPSLHPQLDPIVHPQLPIQFEPLLHPILTSQLAPKPAPRVTGGVTPPSKSGVPIPAPFSITISHLRHFDADSPPRPRRPSVHCFTTPARRQHKRRPHAASVASPDTSYSLLTTLRSASSAAF